MTLSVRTKLVAASLGFLLLGSLGATALNLALLRSWVEEGLRERAIAFAREVAATIGDQRELEGSARLERQIIEILIVRPNVLQVDILAFSGGDTRVVASSNPRERLPFNRPDGREVRAGRVVSHLVTMPTERSWEVMAPIRLQGAVAGAVAARFSIDRSDRLSTRIRSWSFGLTAALVVVEVVLMGLVVRLFVDRPIRRFLDVIRRLETGDTQARVGLRTQDEFGVLAESFDGLLDRETGFQEELRTRVAEATAELDRRYREVERLNGLLFTMQRTLSQVDRLALAGRIMAEVAHEVGTPLHSVAGHLELLRRDLPAAVLTDGLARRFGIIERELSRVTEIIAQLLDLTRRAPGEPIDVDLNRVVLETLDLVRPGLAAARLALRTELAPDLPPVVGHATPLQQVVLNLVTNAMDATPPGGRLVVRTRTAGDAVSVEVEDTGEGISGPRQKEIFEPFFTTKAPGRGTGLGLYISAQIVRDHHGRIEVASEPGRGSTFRVVLPVAVSVAR
ncbi:MAG: hypothetical protein DMD79_05195 [Candidatus Rokuibacteriota bacterium]|nr:MAG: hypothetical protein DMD79_05195 [Candidatus Rokubacteria bacterium]